MMHTGSVACVPVGISTWSIHGGLCCWPCRRVSASCHSRGELMPDASYAARSQPRASLLHGHAYRNQALLLRPSAIALLVQRSWTRVPTRFARSRSSVAPLGLAKISVLHASRLESPWMSMYTSGCASLTPSNLRHLSKKCSRVSGSSPHKRQLGGDSSLAL